MDQYLNAALELGFDEAGWLDTDVIRFLPDIRKMCTADKCGSYGKNWGCPPGCGTLEECAGRVKSYPKGLIFTSVARMEDPFDYEAIDEGAKKIRRLGNALRERLQADGMTDVWLMMPGGCGECAKCQYPDKCLHPERATTSPEAQGMWVSEICTQGGVLYNNGKSTVTYVGLAFFREPAQ